MPFLRQRLAELSHEWREARFRQPRLALGVLLTAIVVAAAPLVVGGWFLMTLREGFPDLAAIQRIGEMDQATAVFDEQDRLAFTIYKEQRIEVPLAQVSPHVVRALTAIEDQRFFEHRGYDLVRIASAAMENVRRGRAAQGASTLTQQLARQSFLRPDKTLHRKIQELILAARIEQMYTKPQILELYLNKVYFGDGLYGIEAASRGFLGKHASELGVADSAMLAGLVKSPSTYAPTVSLPRALARRNMVLQAMLEAGTIDKPTFQAAQASKVVLRDGLRADEPHGQHFKEAVRIELVQRFGWHRVYQGGLRVFTTVNMPLQMAAEAAVADALEVLDARRAKLAVRRASLRKKAAPPPADVEPLQAALTAMDPETGHVRAMVGGRDFAASRFNRATQAQRQAGSAFKPFIYAAALEEGYSPASVIRRLDDPIATPSGAWTPEDEHSTASSMTLRTGLRTSSNRAAVRLLQEVGIGRTVRYVKSLGMANVPAVPSLALGSGEVTLQSMTAAYAAFANHGLVPKPVIIRRVEDADGRVLFEARDASTRAISDTTAFLMSAMMSDVINAGTGNRARQLGFTLPAAGKTGTTNDFHDAWFIGFTPKIVTGVWVGFDQPRTIMPNGFAGDVAVPLWTNFMKIATRGDKPQWLTPPTGVTSATVCRLSGRLATDDCRDAEYTTPDGWVERRSMAYTEYFARGTGPTGYCDLHQSPGFFTRVAGAIGLDTAPPLPQVQAVATPVVPPPPAVPAVHSSPSVEPESPAAPVKKRGFWSRVFRRGDGESRKPETPKKPRDRDR